MNISKLADGLEKRIEEASLLFTDQEFEITQQPDQCSLNLFHSIQYGAKMVKYAIIMFIPR